MSKTKRNGNIEILRFIFSVLIVLYHLSKIGLCTIGGHTFFRSGYLAVEFFFIVSGIFLGKKLSKDRDIHEKQTLYTSLAESRKYVFSRIKSIYCYFLASIIICEIVKILMNSESIIEIGLKLPNELLFLGALGFKADMVFIVVVWFLSALFCALYLLYPIVYKKYNVFVKYYAPFIAILCYGILIMNTKSVDATLSFMGIISVSIVRAIAGISLGTVVNEVSVKLSEIKLSKTGTAFVTLLEICAYFVVFGCITIFDKGLSDCLFILTLAPALAITLSKKSLLNGKFDNKFSMFLGKSSMLIYMNHYLWVTLLKQIAPFATEQWQKILVVLILTVISSTVSYFVGNLLKIVFTKIKKLFIVNTSVENN